MNDKINYFAAPGVSTLMEYKLSHKGVTRLNDTRQFKSRITGSRSHIVLPDGTLVKNETRQSLKGNIELTKDADRKKYREMKKKRLAAAKLEGLAAEKDEKKERRYFVNEKIISARVFSYIQAMKKPVLHFFTISFPPVVTDDLGYQYLNTWLTVAKTSLRLKDHLFVAERQEIGTVHFHIMIPQYFSVQRANAAMKTILKNEIKKGRLSGYTLAQAAKYNGVDIAKNRLTGETINFADPRRRKTLVSYITKYVSKGKKNTDRPDGGFSHLAWHNSRGFSSMFTGISLTNQEKNLNSIGYMVNRFREFKGEFFTWCPWLDNKPPDLFSVMLRKVNQLVMNNEDKVKLKYS